MKRRIAALVMGCVVTCAAVAQQMPPAGQSSADRALPADGAPPPGPRDYSEPALRKLAFECDAGDIALHAGQSLDQVFGKDWPERPAASPEAAYRPVDKLKPGRIIWPRGMEGKGGAVLVAVLVGADGKALRAEPICASTVGFDMAARRAAMTATYQAATLGDQPYTSVWVSVIGFKSTRKGSRQPGAVTDD